MTLVFWCAAITMVVIAMLFFTTPFRRAIAGRPVLIAALAILFPALVFGIYALIGSPDSIAIDRGAELAASGSPGNSERNGTQKPGTVASLLGGLKSRLEENPDDAGGWLLLAQSYRHLGDSEAADVAYQRAKALGMADSSFESGETSTQAVKSIATSDAGVRISGLVSLAPEIAKQVRPDDTVFIFAKESKAHRMPVAAIRRPAAALPIDFELTNAHAMIAGADLADYESLIVTARVSRSGLATDSAAGWETWSAPISPLDDDIVELVIAVTDDPKGTANE